MRRWIELSLAVPSEAADAVSDHLIGLGAPGVIEEDAAGAAGSVRLRVHFPDSTSPDALEREARSFLGSLEPIFPGCARASPKLAFVVDEDWAEGWKRNFPPLEIGRSLRVRTPWWPASSDRLEIEILPAMAFGTGHHATTVGCLLELEARISPGAGPVLDLGTGSAILAIAAARLGARRVLALDVDPVAVDAARENVARNRLEDVIDVSEGGIGEATGSFALIVANLYGPLLRSLFAAMRLRMAAGGTLIVSGLLDPERALVASSAAENGLVERGARSIEGWTTLVFEKGE